ncbi:hypothetical protein SLEP1_g26600 [Rubroshorea leprosula]|uniref:Wound-responsive family protein n=1 Tax=Rubroshorea leprosula TaxID=152421 RepID=A0AAV5JTV9_9ROSI|nr:hypothetical protein SLEP1_g26600 [Rubroshorea leprosula]
MSTGSRTWLVAAAIGAVEALKDQGICRWNYTIRTFHQHAKNKVRSFAQARMLSSSTLQATRMEKARWDQRKKAEVTMERVVQMNCWGPSTVRF